MAEKILVCTVGGSPDPIVTAIRETAPDFVLFVCSGGERSSRPQVENADGIAATAGLHPTRWKIVEIPPDELSTAFATCVATLEQLTARHPDAELRCDYTGGTKTMTAALALAALTVPQATLQLTTGSRQDLVKVTAGTEHVMTPTLDLVHAEFEVARAADAWAAFAYDAAAELLERAHRAYTLSASTRELRRRKDHISRLLAASRSFAAWDRFDHEEAFYAFKNGRVDQLADLRHYGTALQTLVSENREPLTLLDLWHNAERRAARRRFDDAVARLYRLVEWSAQYVLRTERGIETARFDPTCLPAGELRLRLETRAGNAGAVPIGLTDALRVLRELLPDHSLARRLATGVTGTSPLEELDGWITARNHSLLAHGFKPVDELLWRRARDWMQRFCFPWLEEELRAREQSLRQFPTRFPA